MRPVFVGNLDYDTRHSELDRLFYRYGRIDRIDMKSGLPLPSSPPVFFFFPRELLDPVWCSYTAPIC
jgi:arginine/serine-rich splicing factor 4/5/6